MKKLSATLLFVLVAVCLCIGFAACEKKEKTVAGISVLSEPAKTVYLKDEPFDISGGKIAIRYSDGKITELDMNSEMYEAADTSSYGKKELTLKFSVDDAEYSLLIVYRVIFSQASYEFSVLSETLPALNQVTVGDAENIVQAIEKYNALTEDEKNYLAENESSAYEKVQKLEKRVLPAFFDASVSRAEEFLENLNISVYEESDIVSLEEYIGSFTSGDFVSLSEVMAAESEMYANIEALPKKTDDPSYTVEEHRANSIASLRDKLCANIYEITDRGLTGSTIDVKTIDYGADPVYSERLAEIFAPIEAAEDIAAVDAVYGAAAQGIKDFYLEVFSATAKNNLFALMEGWRATAKSQLDRWDKETISLPRQFDGINVDYMNDNRWWTPIPYRLDVLLNSVEEKLAKAESVRQINEWYETYAYEIVRATMQRNIELYYTIERNLNVAYDANYDASNDTFTPTDVMYWNIVATYWGASTSAQFIYNGIVDEYVGQVFGTSDANAYRFAAEMYKPGECGKTISELVEKYDGVMKRLIPAPRTVAEILIETMPEKTAYDVGEDFTVSGGVIKVVYSDHTSERINMTEEMYDPEEIDTQTIGAHTVTLTFTANGEQHTVELHYAVALPENVSALTAKIDELPEPSLADESFYDEVEECLLIYAELTQEEKGLFDVTPQSQKLVLIQKALMGYHTQAYREQLYRAWETMNYYWYEESNRALLESKFNEVVTALAAAETFAQADASYEGYLSDIKEIATLADGDTSLADLKAYAKQSSLRVTEVSLYAVSEESTPSGLRIELQTVSLKENEAVAAALAALDAAIEAASDAEALAVAYEEGIDAVYAAVLAAYRTEALANVKSLVEDVRSTVKEIWEQDAFEGDASLAVDYMQNVGEYANFTPDPYKVSVLYNGITLGEQKTKAFAFAEYEAAYVDMLRSVLYRNMHTVFFYKVRTNPAVAQFQWSVLHWCFGAAGQAAFEYDGVLEEYKGTKIGETSDYRLWGWGYQQGQKVTTVGELVEKYNYDIANFLI